MAASKLPELTMIDGYYPFLPNGCRCREIEWLRPYPLASLIPSNAYWQVILTNGRNARPMKQPFEPHFYLRGSTLRGRQPFFVTNALLLRTLVEGTPSRLEIFNECRVTDKREPITDNETLTANRAPPTTPRPTPRP